MANEAKNEAGKIGDIHDSGNPVRHFFKFFLGDAVSLLDLRKAYFDSENEMRAKIHNDYGKGEWLADVVETDGAKVSSKGHVKVVYVQRPEGINLTNNALSRDAHLKTSPTEGGNRISYDCPPSGWVVPDGDLLWHPETGAALATVESRVDGIKALAGYIEKHPEKFKGWTLPEKSYAQFLDIFGRDCNPKSPTSKQLAELELSYQWAPGADSGARVVRRDFQGNCGPFCIHMVNDINSAYANTGFRLRTRA
jgi:hypothetical protein